MASAALSFPEWHGLIASYCFASSKTLPLCLKANGGNWVISCASLSPKWSELRCPPQNDMSDVLKAYAWPMSAKTQRHDRSWAPGHWRSVIPRRLSFQDGLEFITLLTIYLELLHSIPQKRAASRCWQDWITHSQIPLSISNKSISKAWHTNSAFASSSCPG